MPIIWAINPASGLNKRKEYLNYHSVNRGLVHFTLSPPNITAHPIHSWMAKFIHGMGMITVWLMLFPSAVFWARYLKFVPHWNTIHTAVQITSFSGIIVFVYIIASSYVNLHATHAKLGLSLLTLLTVQVAAGITSLIGLWFDQVSGIRDVVKMVHRYVGITMILLACVQAALGLDTLFPWVIHAGTWIWNGYIALLSFWVLIFGIAEVYFVGWVRRRNASADVKLKARKDGAVEMGTMNTVDRKLPAEGATKMFTWETLDDAVLSG